MTKTLSVFAGAVVLCAFAAPVQASPILLGSSVTGSITFGGGGTNFYDPGNGFVPGGCGLNAAGTTVTIADPAIEFCFADGANADRANFTDTTITLTDAVIGTQSDASWVQVFTDAAFLPLTFTKISDNFPNGITLVKVGNQLTFSTPAYAATGNYSATFQVVSTPEPASLLLLGSSLVGLGARLRRNLKR